MHLIQIVLFALQLHLERACERKQRHALALQEFNAFGSRRTVCVNAKDLDATIQLLVTLSRD
jgi:hypothetical protein